MTALRVRNQRPVSVMNEFDRIFSNLERPEYTTANSTPAVDVRETEDTYNLEADLPGLEKKDIEIKVEDDILHISAKAEVEEKTEAENNVKYLLNERKGRQFHRTFRLPKDADRTKIAASFDKGVLSLEIQKAEEAKPFSITID